jgi:hypothetical protein
MPSVGAAMDSAFQRGARGDEQPWETDSLSPLTHDRGALKMTLEARSRRAHLAKYVKAVVGGCAAICGMAGVRASLTAASEHSRPASTAAVSVAMLPVPPTTVYPPAPTELPAIASTSVPHPVSLIKPSQRGRLPH